MHFKLPLLVTSLFASAITAASIPTSDSSLSSRATNASSTVPRNGVYVGQIWGQQPNKTSNGTHIELLPLIQNNSTVTHVILFGLAAFADNTTELGGVDISSPNYAWLPPQIKALQCAGVKVMASIGGAGNRIFQKLDQDFNTYYPLLRTATKTLALDGLDLDIEVPVPLNSTLHLLRSFNADFGPNFTLTLAPVSQALYLGPDPLAGGFSYHKLDSLATDATKPSGKIIDFFNAQFYSGGTPGNGSAAAQIQAYGEIVKAGWDANRVSMALATYNFDRESWRTIAGYEEEVKSLVERFPSFGGVTGWEYWNAGLNDNAVEERWEWVRDIGRALYG
ncbi:hypothetical protein MMC10_010404 [Thelotrema lepadinum]|nr:hypothetical protein [Thelotrema lepadinum]